MDHQSVGLIARSIENAGLPTIYLGSCRDIMKLVNAPRSVFVDFPLGHQSGKPGDIQLQTQILRDTLDVLVNAKTPGTLVDLTYQWGEPFDWNTYLSDVKEMVDEEKALSENLIPIRESSG